MAIKTIFFLTICLLSTSCNNNEDSSDNETEYKLKMREFVIGISQYSESINPNFNIIP